MRLHPEVGAQTTEKEKHNKKPEALANFGF
jgi:hypothetical protein